MSDLVAKEDTGMHRCSVEEMSDQQLQDHIVNKRERRMKAYNLYEEAVKLEKETYNQKLLLDVRKQSEMLAKDLGTIDKALERAEKRMVKIIAIRNELGITVGDDTQPDLFGDQNGSQTTRDTVTSTEQSRSGSDNIHVRTSRGTASDAADAEGDGGCSEPDVGHSDVSGGCSGEHEEHDPTGSE